MESIRSLFTPSWEQFFFFSENIYVDVIAPTLFNTYRAIDDIGRFMYIGILIWTCRIAL